MSFEESQLNRIKTNIKGLFSLIEQDQKGYFKARHIDKPAFHKRVRTNLQSVEKEINDFNVQYNFVKSTLPNASKHQTYLNSTQDYFVELRQKFYQIDDEQKNLNKISSYGNKDVPDVIDDKYIRSG